MSGKDYEQLVSREWEWTDREKHAEKEKREEGHFICRP